MKSIIGTNIHLFLVVCLITTARASWWDDFTNNLATDLAPLISLFGERTTTQFLSESTTLLDNFLFAMAPLGILTGVVSAIRVCGGPSLRAFIGRAQEGGGVAEAELCSSTSRDVCELYHNGAIIRTFGRPKIVEIVYDLKHDEESTGRESTFGLFSPQDWFASHREKYREEGHEVCGKKGCREVWAESHKKAPGQYLDHEKAERDNNSIDFAPNPNLSFNIGIQKRPGYVHWAAAIFGFLAQASVLVFGAAVQYQLHWTKDEGPIERWAFPFTLCGTVCVCGGMFLCAFLVNDSTKERRFQRSNGKLDSNRKPDTNNKEGPRLYVVQPGNQVIGDQTFDSFLFSSEPLSWTDYITSWKISKPPRDENLSWVRRRLKEKPSSENLVLVATFTTMVGFVFQFVGLRSMHSAVSLLQLAVTLGMSVVRALLRTQRLRAEQNLLRDNPDDFSGHELDWLALHINSNQKTHGKELELFSWCITPGASIYQPMDPIDEQRTNACLVYSHRARLAKLTQPLTHPRSKASNAWGDGQVVGRSQAQRLSRAIRDTLDIISQASDFKQVITKTFLDEEFTEWALPVLIQSRRFPMRDNIVIRIRKGKLGWTAIDPIYLEAILGLWSWSINFDTCAERESVGPEASIAAGIPIYRIVSAGAEDEAKRTWESLQLWMDGIPPSSSKTFPIKNFFERGYAKNGPTKVWKVDPSTGGLVMRPLNNISQILPDTPLDSFRRLVGWRIIGSHRQKVIYMVSAESTSIPTNCSHDIYQSFLYAIAKHITFDKMQVESISEANRFRLEHQLVTKLINCFEMNGLGSRQDAFLVVLPALEYGSRFGLPRVRESISAAYRDAEGLRKDGSFQEAEASLRWAWKTASTMEESEETTMIELGELYRYALRSGTAKTIKFGRDGIDWMSKQARSPLDEISKRYSLLYSLLLDADPQRSWAAKDVLNAIRKNDRAETLLALTKFEGSDLSVSDSEGGRTVLSFAAEKGWHEVVKASLETGSDVDSRDKWDRTPLSYAAEHGHDDAIKCLCKHGAHIIDINGTNREGYTPLIATLLNNRRRKVARQRTAELLIEKGARLDVIIREEEVWRWALREGEWACAEFLLQHDETKWDIGVELELRYPSLSANTIVRGVNPGVRIRVLDAAGEEIELNMETVSEIAAGEYNVEVRYSEEYYTNSIACEKPFKFLNGLLDQLEDEDPIPAKMLVNAAKSRYGMDALLLLLDRPEEVKITDEVVNLVLEKISTENVAIFRQLLARDAPITEEMLREAAVRYNYSEELSTLLRDHLDRRRDGSK